MALRQTVPPETEPVTLEEMKEHLRLDGAEEDALIESLIASARQYAEALTCRQLVTATWRLTLDAFPAGCIVLPRPRLQEVLSIQYVDAAGDTQTLAPELYQVDAESEPARLSPAFNTFWPGTRHQMNAVVVTIRCGYGAAADVPAGVKTAIRMLAAHYYENREAATDVQLLPVPMAVKSLLSPERIFP